MSDGWIRDVIAKLKDNTSTATVGDRLEVLFRDNKSIFQKTVSGVDRTTEEIVILKLDSY